MPKTDHNFANVVVVHFILLGCSSLCVVERYLFTRNKILDAIEIFSLFMFRQNETKFRINEGSVSISGLSVFFHAIVAAMRLDNVIGVLQIHLFI